MKRYALLLMICLLFLTAFSVFANDADFVIDENGVLTSYTGSDENVVIPDGVTAIGNWVFEYKSGIKTVTIPNTVTSIGYYAFSGCGGLTKIEIPYSVTSVGYNAFYYCDNLTDVTINIPNSVTSIDDNRFSGWNFVTSINIPDSVTSIGKSAFSGCSSLSSINIPDSVTSIGNSAFSGCSSLSSINIPDSVTSIGNSAFSGCSSLSSINIPDSVKEIGSDAFWNCSSLTSITIPNGVTTIQSGTFYKCENLANVTIPDSVTSILGSSDNKDNWDSSWRTRPAFGYCSNLTQITLPETLQSIGSNAFSGCNLTGITIPANVNSIGENAFAATTQVYAYHNTYAAEWAVNNNMMPNYLDNAQSGWNEWHGVWWNYSGTVLSIKGDLYGNYGTDYPWNKYHLYAETIIIEDGTKSIGPSYFYDFQVLANITIPYSITSIGSSAFNNCLKLQEINLPNSITEIGNNAFSGCSSLVNISIPDGVISVGKSAFRGCSNLTNITIPDSVINIGAGAFRGCSRLANIILPNKLISIEGSEYSWQDGGLFAECSSLNSIIIPNGVTSIGNYAFDGCTNLTNVSIPGSVTSIGSYAFSGCTNLTSIIIPDNITSISSYAFYNCNSLTDITIPNSVTSVKSYALSKCSSLTSITIPGSIESIESNSFGNNLFNNVEILGGVKTIHDNAFTGGAAIDKVIIPDSVRFIGPNAFDKPSGIYAHAGSYAEEWAKENGHDLFIINDDESITLPNLFITDENGVLTRYIKTGDKNVVIPDGITAIGDSVFYGKGTSETTIGPDGISIISYYTPYFESVTIPASVTSIGKNAIDGQTIIYAYGNSYASQWAKDHSNTLKLLDGPFEIDNNGVLIGYYGEDEYIIIPEGVKEIGSYVFNGNNTVKTIALPDGVTSIGYGSFSNCSSLESVTIPASVTSINYDAFYSSNPAVYASNGSYAEEWANNNGYSLHPIEEFVFITPTPMTVIDPTATPTSALVIETPDPTATPTVVFITETPQPTEVSIQGTLSISGSDRVTVKQSITLTALISGELANYNSSVYWSTSNKKIATVSGGTVTGKKAGTVEIQACAVAYPSVCASKTITVIPLGKKVIISDNDNGTKTIDLGTKGTSVEKITYQLSASVSPAEAEQGITWSSQDPSIATVDRNGLVTATGTGKVNINATATDGSRKFKSFKLNVVSSIQDGSIVLSGEDLVIQKKKVTLNVAYTQAVQPVKAKLVWSSSDPSIAKVSNKGVVTGAYGGTAVIKACSAANQSYCGSFTMTVEGIASSVVINDIDNGTNLIDIGTAGTANQKLTYRLSANVLPANVKQEVTWSSSNPAVASVDENGVVTGHSAGSAAITATSNDDAHKKTKVTIKVTSNVQPGSLTISGPDTFGIKESKTLTAVFNQLNQPVKNKVRWASSDPRIAKVSNGTVTGVSDGTAVITACSASNSAVCASQNVIVGTISLPEEPVFLMMAAASAENIEDGSGLMSFASEPDTFPEAGSAEETPEAPAETQEPTEEPTPEPTETIAAETAVPENNNSLQFAQEEINLQVGESLALDIVNPEAASFMVMVKGDENALSFDETENTVTGLAEGDTVAYLANVNTVDIVDTMPIHVLSAQPLMMMAAVIPAENGSAELTEESTAEPTPEPTAEPTETTAAETAVPENNNTLQFAQEEINLQVGESLALDIVNPEAASFMVMVKGDENALSFDETENTVTGLAEGDTVAYLADTNTVDIVDTMPIHVLSAQPLMMMAAVIPAEDGAVELTDEPTAEPTEEPATESVDESTVEPTDGSTTGSLEELTAEPTEESAAEPTEEPTDDHTDESAAEPTDEPTAEPTDDPTAEPTEESTTELTEEPTADSADGSTAEPTDDSTAEPTDEPTAEPKDEPTAEPTDEPTVEPTEDSTAEPTDEPTAEPTDEPTTEPTDEPTAEPTDEPTAEPTDEPTAEPTNEPTVEPTEEPTPAPLIDPYFDSDEYELRVGETMQVWYHNPDNQTVYLVLAEGSENVVWDETSFTITAAESGDLTILLTSVVPYAVKARCVVHILEPEKIPADIFRDEETKMVTNELIRLNDLLIEENAENYEVLIDDHETYKDYLYWNDEQDTLTALKPGDVKLILRYPGSEEDLDSIIIHIETAPEPETDPAPTEEPIPDTGDQPGADIIVPDPAETDTTEPGPAESTEPDPSESEETPSDPAQTNGENPEAPAEGTDPEDTPADPGGE